MRNRSSGSQCRNEKKLCESDENYLKKKQLINLKLSVIQSAKSSILNIINTPECRERLPGHVLSSLVTLGTSVAAIGMPGVGGVAASAAAEILNSAIKLYTSDNGPKKLLQDQTDLEHFQSFACLYVDFKNKYYNCSADSETYINHLDELKNKNASNAKLSNWIESLNQSPEDFNNIKLFKGGPNFPEFIDSAKSLDCLGLLDSKKPSYAPVLQAAQCMDRKISKNNNLQKTIPTKEKIESFRKLPSIVNTASFNEKNVQDLFVLSNDSDIQAIGCHLNNFPKNSEDFQMVVLNASGKDAKDPESIRLKEVNTNLNSFLNCLIVKRPKNSIDGNNIYKAILASEMAYKAQFEEPLVRARFSLMAGELSPAQKNTLDMSFKSLMLTLKNDKIFTGQLSTYAEKLKNGIKNAMEQKGVDPMDVAYPLFNACLQLNPLRFKTDEANDGKTTFDASTISPYPISLGKKHLFKKDDANDFSSCNLLSCVLPKTNWKDGDKDEVEKYKEMACDSYKSSRIFEDNLNLRLAKLKMLNKNLDAETYLSKICEVNDKKKSGANSENHNSVTK